MKRSEALQSLSREHHKALTLAKACERAVGSGDAEQLAATCHRAVEAFANELEPHFRIEEQSLLPLLKEPDVQGLVQRTLADHVELRALVKKLERSRRDTLERFGKTLSEHVRFEERELFPALEKVLD